MRCNLQCAHCCAEAGAPVEGELDTAEAGRMFGELADLGVEHLCISGGEVTLRADWEALVAAALARFHNVAFITNGRLGARLFERLEHLERRDALSVMVSLDGTRDIHDARRGRGSFDKAVEVLGAPTRVRRDVITTVGTDNLADLDALERTVRALGVSEWTLQPAVPIGRMSRDSFLGGAGLRTLADFVVAAGARNRGVHVSTTCSFGYFHEVRERSPWTGCPAAKRGLAIMAQGDVTACVAVPEWTVGNVRTSSLRELWESPQMDALRRERPASCEGCARCPGGCSLMERAVGRQHCTLE